MFVIRKFTLLMILTIILFSLAPFNSQTDPICPMYKMMFTCVEFRQV